MANLLKAKPLVDLTLEKLQAKCDSLKEKGIVPSMRVILVGENPASVIYTRNKRKFCHKFGADCEIVNLAADLSEEQFLAEVEKIGNDPKVHGCFIQLPLPKHLQHLDVGSLIPAGKDVDGFHSENINKLFHGDTGQAALLPCTPKGIISLLEHNNISLEGKNVAIIGRSHIVGKPLALLMNNHNATVTLCHSRTRNIKEITREADIVVSAVGNPRFLNAEYFSDQKNQVVVDVGINHDSEGKLCGDVDFDSVEPVVAGITPVPGGVGPMTILSLAQNLLQAAENSL